MKAIGQISGLGSAADAGCTGWHATNSVVCVCIHFYLLMVTVIVTCGQKNFYETFTICQEYCYVQRLDKFINHQVYCVFAYS